MSNIDYRIMEGGVCFLVSFMDDLIFPANVLLTFTVFLFLLLHFKFQTTSVRFLVLLGH
jgi:hypothetical protein